MSQIAKGIFAVVAVSLTCGAVQLAFGQDLTNRLRSFASASPESVSRAAKTDRLARVATPPITTQTIAFHVDRFPATSILVRVPAKDASNSTAPAPGVIQIKDQRKAATVACEPVVSVLTEIAKRLEPGRCVT
jgi:hypothetical protein